MSLLFSLIVVLKILIMSLSGIRIQLDELNHNNDIGFIKLKLK